MIILDPRQQEAVDTALTTKVMILTGGPGVGKTTVCNSIIDQLKDAGYRTILCACPTGKAAKRLAEQTKREAMTIHRLLKYNPNLRRFEHNELYPLEGDALIVDEMSMVDIDLFDALLTACPRGDFRVIMVGDVDQLPSVGPGNVLKDLIDSGRIPTVRLDTIHRQSPDSWISHNAARVNKGKELHLGPAEDFFWLEREDPEDVAKVVVALAAKKLPEKYGLDPLTEIQVLAPQRRGVIGTENLNRLLQTALNPARKGKTVWKNVFGQPFSPGDKVIHVRNNYVLGVYNGETGVVVDVLYNNGPKGELLVDFEDRKIVYTKDQAVELQLSYALTIHKSQGSEYKCVVIPVHKSHAFMLSRSLLYTGITRGKERVYLVGNKDGLKRAIKNNRVKSRYTTLCKKLKER